LRPDRDITDPRIAKALAHPLRLRILGLLDDRIASPKELAAELSASLGVVSYHVRVLASEGFLELVGTQPRRGATEHYYRAVSRPVVTSEVWEDMPGILKEEVVSSALANISAQVNAAARTGGFQRGDAHLTRSPLILDDQAFAQVATKLDRLLVELERLSAAAERRLERREHHGEIRATAVLMLFETPLAGSDPEADGCHDSPGEARHGRSTRLS
jgi:DNA-binding transcriptional ArsR family regulator